MQTIIDRAGHVGKLIERRYLDDQHSLIELNNGLRLIVETAQLVDRADGTLYLPINLSEALNGGRTDVAAVLPLVAEELHIEKEQVEVGRVRIHKHVDERQIRVDEPRIREQVDVQRHPINQYIEEAPPIRYEGETMIIPIVEEVIVIEKRLMLKEELHVTKQRIEEREPIEVTVRKERAEIERISELDHLAVTRKGSNQGE